MSSRALPSVLALAFLAGCQGPPSQNMTASEAADMANAELAQVLPQVSLSRQRIETEDLNGKWRVSYHAPEGSTGGPLVIDVDKQSREARLVSMEH